MSLFRTVDMPTLLQPCHFPEQLIEAVRDGNINMVQKLLEYGTYVNAVSSQGGMTPLIGTSILGNAPLVKLLLHIAYKKGYEDIASLLIKYGADVELENDKGWKALQLAPNGFLDAMIKRQLREDRKFIGSETDVPRDEKLSVKSFYNNSISFHDNEEEEVKFSSTDKNNHEENRREKHLSVHPKTLYRNKTDKIPIIIDRDSYPLSWNECQRKNQIIRQQQCVITNLHSFLEEKEAEIRELLDELRLNRR